MASPKDFISTMPIEANRTCRIGLLVIGRPFLILYINGNARRIIGRIRARAHDAHSRLPREIMAFCHDAADMLAKVRHLGEPATVHLARAITSTTTPLRLRATVMPVGAGEAPSHMLIIIEEAHSHPIVPDHPVKELSLCIADHELKPLS